MKIKTVTGIVFVLILFFAVGTAMSEKGSCPAPKAEPFWEHVTETNPYQGWGYWPEHEGIYPGQSPHGAFLKLYANSIALKALREGQIPLPYGSMIMKANYAKDRKTLMALTPMYKVKDYNPEAGDWFWAKYKPNGEVQAAGKVGGCIDCHRAKKDHDWLFTEIKSE